MSREAYDQLARTPGLSSRGIGRLLGQGCQIETLARLHARPSFPHEDEPFVTPSCEGYPALLKELSDPPFRLFHRGLPLSRLGRHCVAVVGSRKASRYGLCWSRRLGAALASRGISVCSGLAVGIDTAAHQGALEVASADPDAGVPVGVLGHGFAHLYPEQNRDLARRLQEHGLLLSEYPPNHPPSRWTFPERNRIIAGLCHAVVVVEAGPRSGSLHTARFANEAGRDVWVVPNRPGTPNSGGVLALLRDGAIPMFAIEEFVGQIVADLRITSPAPEPSQFPQSLLPLLLALARDEDCSSSHLCQHLACSPQRLARELAELEILGIVQRRFDGGWAVRRWDLVEQVLQPGLESDGLDVA